MINIKYFDSFSSRNNNIIIFISKISELSKISLPSPLPFDIRDKFVNKILNKNKIFDTFSTLNNRVKYRYVIKLIDTNKPYKLNIGSSIYSLFDYEIYKDVTFIFSNYIKSKKPLIISEIVFGYIIKSYKFTKYN